MRTGQTVYHQQFGNGHVQFVSDKTAFVRFSHGIEGCLFDDLTVKADVWENIAQHVWNDPLSTIGKVLSQTIVSVNDSWGVFSKSRIALLPHQLWVCRQVLRQWPTHYLVADDVGLGKTIEAGLILWPLLAKGVVKRLLILCRASLVEQWQFRLKDMFDIRLTQYAPEVDTPRTDFWNGHDQVVASLETMRDDHKGRHERLFSADPWDLLIVDEAHHLNNDKSTGATLGYRLVDNLVKKDLATSRLFFTGTPHRGKDFGFFALLQLLRPDLFNPRRTIDEQLPLLREVFIRNNKQNVVDMQGNKLFKPVTVVSETYGYTEPEQDFYDLMSDFIATGKTYATSLSDNQSRQAIMLVLISMQKLASSSVAAIRKALAGRLYRLKKAQDQLENDRKSAAYKDLLSSTASQDTGELTDDINRQEGTIIEEAIYLSLMQNEIEQLEILLGAADAVTKETKIAKILEVLENRFAGRSVLLFTEYKATQALLMAELRKKYGPDCVTFINGDGRLEIQKGDSNEAQVITQDRYIAADDFNAGKVRFLISTEAAGEGIDLQESCHTLIHVDLPWNPMRLHQRVGRLNRYGQQHAVDVLNLRNPATVETRIWDKLNEKIARIMEAFGSAMDDPEDLLQLVLGMASEGTFNKIFSGAPQDSTESLDNWFNEKEKTFGGEDVIETVKKLVGNAHRFDMGNLEDIPPTDLVDLQPFFELMLTLNKRRINREDSGMGFKTPEAWLTKQGIRRKYEGLTFSRELKGRDAAIKVIGIGHRVFDAALEQAVRYDDCLASFSGLKETIAVFKVFDQVTAKRRNVNHILLGISSTSDRNGKYEIIKDWELIKTLNEAIPLNRSQDEQSNAAPEAGYEKLQKFIENAEERLHEELPLLNLPFADPEIQPVALLVPAPSIKSADTQPA